MRESQNFLFAQVAAAAVSREKEFQEFSSLDWTQRVENKNSILCVFFFAGWQHEMKSFVVA